MSYDASDRKHVKEALKASKISDRQVKGVVRGIMSSPQGRQWVFELLSQCHLYSSSHTGNALNTAFAEGERNMGLVILSQVMSACPDQYILAMREADARDHAAESRRDREDGNGGDSQSSPAPDDPWDDGALLTADELARIEGGPEPT
jgi:hypothetical protein